MLSFCPEESDDHRHRSSALRSLLQIEDAPNLECGLNSGKENIWGRRASEWANDYRTWDAGISEDCGMRGS